MAHARFFFRALGIMGSGMHGVREFSGLLSTRYWFCLTLAPCKLRHTRRVCASDSASHGWERMAMFSSDGAFWFAVRIIIRMGEHCESPKESEGSRRITAPVLPRELTHYRGEPDPFKGDAPNQRVRDSAKEAVDSLFGAENAPQGAPTPPTLQVRRAGP